MRVSESRGHLWTMPSESILEQAKLGQLRIIVPAAHYELIFPNLTKFPNFTGIKKDTRE